MLVYDSLILGMLAKFWFRLVVFKNNRVLLLISLMKDIPNVERQMSQ